MTITATKETEESSDELGRGADVLRPSLVVLHATDVTRIGEALVPRTQHSPYVFGRGARADDDPQPRLSLVRQRPGRNEPCEPFEDEHVSRVQLSLTWKDDRLVVENLGRRELLDGDGKSRKTLELQHGDLLEIKGKVLFLCVSRPPVLPAARSWGKLPAPFGQADNFGFVGESAVAWKLRDAAAFLGARSAHVLLLGESGTGKEIAARMVHEISTRSAKRLVSRNAATLPAGLIDAELFGHVANYPNAGMPERTGLVAEADGSTLFLDEIGELPHELQTRLLRVLDERGEYQRLGDPRPRTSRFRLIAATNRAASALKHDVAARFRLRLSVPTIAERREDIPLVARHLLRKAAVQDPEIGERFLEGWDGRTGEPRLALPLVRELVKHEYRTHVRELDSLLWASLASSPGRVAELTEETLAALGDTEPESVRARVDVREVDAETVKAAIAKAGGVHEKAWRDLGLANRHVLKRLVKKFGL